jgi:HNH endonuclease
MLGARLEFPNKDEAQAWRFGFVGPQAGISRKPEREDIMISISPKLPRWRIDLVSYETLRQLVLRHNGWRCQSCGTMLNLEVHHQQFRSHSGNDSEENLITLCTQCHSRVHGT